MAVETTEEIAEEPTPFTYSQAMRCTNKRYWQEAINNELQALAEHDTYAAVAPPPGVKVLKGKWIFTVKRDTHNKPIKCKARYVACGYDQIYLEHYEHTKASVADSRSFRLVFCLANNYHMELAQADVSSAYLNGHLEETIFMMAPEGSDDICWRLKRPLYGLKQAGHNWRQHVDKTLQEAGYQPCDADPGLYFWRTSPKQAFLALHVDDMLIATQDKDLQDKTIKSLQAKYKLKVDLHPTWLLHMRITYNQELGQLKLDQQAYAEDISKRFLPQATQASKTVKTPQPTNQYLAPATDDEAKAMTEVEKGDYQGLVGSLAYLATHTRPDLSFTVGQLGKYLHKPCQRHMSAALHALRYLSSTTTLGLVYTRPGTHVSGGVKATAYSDANFAQDSDRHSIAATAVFIYDNPITWSSHRIRHITSSTEEAELSAASEAAREAIAIRSILTQLACMVDQPITLLIDNKPTVAVATNLGYYPRLKHVAIRHRFAAEAHNNRLITITWCSSQEQLADLLTKPMAAPLFKALRDKYLR
jgi:hypothetical protein